MNNDQIVVGVDAYPGTRPAVAWAVAEARLRNSAVVLIHAVESADTELASSYGAVSSADRRAAGGHTLEAQVAAARRIDPSVVVGAELSVATPADALIDASATASILVLGTNGVRDLGTSILGTVGHRVAANAHCPVVIVTESAAVDARAAAPVVVGLAPTASGRQALRWALAEARLRGCGVTAVRAGSTDSADDVARLLAAVAEDYPDVAVEVVREGSDTDPALTLLASAARASLLVLGRCQHRDPWSSRLGAVTTSVLSRARCPVLIADRG